MDRFSIWTNEIQAMQLQYSVRNPYNIRLLSRNSIILSVGLYNFLHHTMPGKCATDEMG